MLNCFTYRSFYLNVLLNKTGRYACSSRSINANKCMFGGIVDWKKGPWMAKPYNIDYIYSSKRFDPPMAGWLTTGWFDTFSPKSSSLGLCLWQHVFWALPKMIEWWVDERFCCLAKGTPEDALWKQIDGTSKWIVGCWKGPKCSKWIVKSHH